MSWPNHASSAHPRVKHDPFTKCLCKNRSWQTQTETWVSHRNIPHLADLPSLVLENVWSQLGSQKKSAAVFLHGQAGDGLATQTWWCNQNGHKPLAFQSLIALFVQKIRCCFVCKKCFSPLVSKKISEPFLFWHSKNTSLHSDVVSWTCVETLYGPMLQHDPATAHLTSSTQSISSRKIESKKTRGNSRSWSTFVRQNQCHTTKIKRPHSPAGPKNHGENPEIA